MSRAEPQTCTHVTVLSKNSTISPVGLRQNAKRTGIGVGSLGMVTSFGSTVTVAPAATACLTVSFFHVQGKPQNVGLIEGDVKDFLAQKPILGSILGTLVHGKTRCEKVSRLRFKVDMFKVQRLRQENLPQMEAKWSRLSLCLPPSTPIV